MPRKHRAKSSGGAADRRPLGELLRHHPGVLKVLHDHGVHFCAGCYLTLFAAPEKAAGYHGVEDPGAFLRDLRKAVARGRRR